MNFRIANGTTRPGLRWPCAILLPALVGLPATAHATAGAYPSPVQITMDLAGARPNAVYSPKLIMDTVTNQMVLYFGGWYQTSLSALPHDSIYRTVCSTPTSCGPVQMVLNPVTNGLGTAGLLNNPSIVAPPTTGRAFYIMYMTGVNSSDPNAGYTPSNNTIYWSTSWVGDGVNWSTPALLTNAATLPSATIDLKTNHVFLYANTNGVYTPPSCTSGLVLYDLGTGGVSAGTPQCVNTGSNKYDNVEVESRRFGDGSIGYQMLGQRVGVSPITSTVPENPDFDLANTVMDYLFSSDGVNFSVASSTIVGAESGPNWTSTALVGQTPGSYLGDNSNASDCWVYYGINGTYTSLGNDPVSNIFLQSWC